MVRIRFLPTSPSPLQSHLRGIMSLYRHRLSRIRSCKSHRQSRHVIQSLICWTPSQSWYFHSCTRLIIDSIPRGFGWIQKLSIFHYAFEALIVNEMRYLTLFEQKFGLSVEVPGAAILRIFGFDALAFWKDLGGLAIIFGMQIYILLLTLGIFIILAYGAMHLLLVERR